MDPQLTIHHVKYSRRCCVCKRTNKSAPKRNTNVFHRLPSQKKYSDILQKWLDVFTKNSLNVEVKTSTQICEDHFEEDDFYVSRGKRYLKKNRVPSIPADIAQTIEKNKATTPTFTTTPAQLEVIRKSYERAAQKKRDAEIHKLLSGTALAGTSMENGPVVSVSANKRTTVSEEFFEHGKEVDRPPKCRR